MTEIRIRVWVDGEEIDLSPSFRGIIERAVLEWATELGSRVYRPLAAPSTRRGGGSPPKDRRDSQVLSL